MNIGGLFGKGGVVDQNRGVIATAVGGAVTGAVPWVAMELVKSGQVGASTAVYTVSFICMVAGALLQWWVKD